MSNISDFWTLNGFNEDPQYDLAKPTRPKKIKNHRVHQQKLSELNHPETYENITRKIRRENDLGNREYKLVLLGLSEERMDELVTQLQFRLKEGGGTAYYMLGINDDGVPIGLSPSDMDTTLGNLEKMCAMSRAQKRVIRRERVKDREVAEVEVTHRERDTTMIDVKVIVLGSGGSGKSTLISVLVNGVKDNGKGSARDSLHRYKHEIFCKRTMSISQHVLGFALNGDSTNFSFGHRNNPAHILDNSYKLVSFIDVAGSEPNAQQAVIGLCSQFPDYGMILHDATQEFDKITLDHLQLCRAMNFPIFFVFTQIDVANEVHMNRSLDQLEQVLSGHKIIVQNYEDVVRLSSLFTTEEFVPIFQVSCVTGENIELLKHFLCSLSVCKDWDEHSNTLFYIDKVILKTGEKTPITGGIVVKGSVNAGQRVYVGPDDSGGYASVQVKSIHCKNVQVRSVRAGHFCAFQLSEELTLRKGMVFIDIDSPRLAAFEFVCEFQTTDDIKTERVCKANYKPLVFIHTIRQSAGIVNKDEVLVKILPGDIFTLRLKFLFHPFYLLAGTRIMIRDTFMTATGLITEVIHFKNQ